MKKIYILMASAALMFAASCNTLEEVNTDSAVETELITVELNPATKTALDADGRTTKWSNDDEVSVTVGGKNIGTLTHVEGNKFSGDVEAGHIGTATATLNYPAGVTEVPTSQKATPNSFAEEAALLEGTTTMEDLRAGHGPEMKNKTALLKFTVETDGAVEFTLGDMTYTITGCVAGPIYYACVAPVANVNLSFTLAGTDGAKSKSGVTFDANKVYNLGSLEIAPEPVYIYVKNDMGWSLVNLYGWEKVNDKNKVAGDWPGTKITSTETVNGVEFLRFEIPADYVGKEIGLIFNNGTKQLSDYFTTLTETTYLRLTPGEPIVVNPQDKSSFKYRVYVYDQAEKKNVNIYYWGVTGSPGWPGTKITNYVDYDYKKLGYFEIPAEAYNGKVFNYLLNVNGDELKTGDLSVSNPTSDFFIGYWNNNGGKGFWMNDKKPYTNADSCN